MKTLFTVVMLCIFTVPAWSQSRSKKKRPDSYTEITPTAADERRSSYQQRLAADSGWFSQVPFKCIGPTVMSGRVVDVDVNPANPAHFYVAYASGGLWVTRNNGTSFEPLFQNEIVLTIGDIAVDWNHGETIWVGTGESNSSRSSYSGFGVFRSDDLGKTWVHCGLSDTHHISRIVLHPENPNTILVGSIGHLYSLTGERGVFVSTDRGQSWTRSLNVPEAGIIDLIIHPDQPDTWFAASWERSRTAWNFVGNGDQSGIWKTTDAGQNWTRITGESSGFPQGHGVGRIGISIGGHGPDATLYAILDNQAFRPDTTTQQKKGLDKKDFIEMTAQQFAALRDEDLTKFLSDNGFPEEHSAAEIKRRVAEGSLKPVALYDYLYDANEDLFNTPVIGAEVYRYEGSSGKWIKTHDDYLDDLVYTYGYYFGVIRVHPDNPQKVYIAGVPLLRSDDGGKTFKGINPDNVHVDHHALWINPAQPGHIINGSDGGVQISYDDGETFINCNTPAVGQFYTVAVDNADPYNVYGGLQDNGVWVGPSTNEPNRDWYATGKYPFEFLLGGDGMQVQVDTRDNQTIYTGYQFGHYSRLSRNQPQSTYIHPSHQLGERPLRWNWQTPILLSRWNQDILFICSNKVHRSTNQGESFETLSGDLTAGGKPGNVPYGTLTCITESPIQFGILATGSDDGLVHVSRDNGYTWENVSAGLPAGLWISRVVLSAHQRDRIYITLNGYRNDHFDAYIYVSENLGKTWTRITSGLPAEPVNVIREDPRSASVLYAGTDHGLYLSIDRGKSWTALGSATLPAVPVHDLAIQEREKELVVATHGRSLWIGSIRWFASFDTVNTNEIIVFQPDDIPFRESWGSSWSKWLPVREPEWKIPVFVPAGPDAEIAVLRKDGTEIYSFTVPVTTTGLIEIDYNLSIPEDAALRLVAALNSEKKEGDSELTAKKADNGKYYLLPGEYIVRVRNNGKEASRNFAVRKKKH